MRIAFILGKFPAVSETFILNQITGLIDRGHEVDIYADKPGDSDKIHPDVESYQLLKRTYYSMMPSNKLKRVIKGLGLLWKNFSKQPKVLVRSLNFWQYNYSKYREQAALLKLFYSAILFVDKKPYDIIHCHFGPYGLRATLLCDIGAIQGKIITTFHGFDVSGYVQQKGAAVYHDLFVKGDWYTVNTAFTGQKAIDLGCPADKITILPVGLNLSLYSFHPPSLNPGEPIKIITVARLVEKKGIEYVIRAVAKLLKKYPNLEYRVVGDGQLREVLNKLIIELDVADRIKLLGWKTQPELRQLYANSQISILASVTASDGDREGQGLVLQEAQAMGIPVISTLHNGIPDGVLDGKSGFLVPERDVDALAEKIAYLIEHPEIWLEMGQAGRNLVEENYDINKLNDRLVTIYEQLLFSD